MVFVAADCVCAEGCGEQRGENQKGGSVPKSCQGMHRIHSSPNWWIVSNKVGEVGEEVSGGGCGWVRLCGF